MALSQEQIDSFFLTGYLAYGALLHAEEIELLRQEYDLVFRDAIAANSYRNLSIGDDAGAEQKRSASSQMLQIMQVCERNIHFRRLLYDSRILDIVQDLIGPNIMLFHDQALFKPARMGGAVFWHQDNAYWRCRPANLVSCWLTLDEAFKENGAMQVIPGSHLKPVQHERSEETNALLDLGKTVDTSQAVVVELPAGGCMFHHCQTLHYTQPNITDSQRRAFVMHFMPIGTRDGKGDVMHVSFHRPLLRMSV